MDKFKTLLHIWLAKQNLAVEELHQTGWGLIAFAEYLDSLKQQDTGTDHWCFKCGRELIITGEGVYKKYVCEICDLPAQWPDTSTTG